jgi:hypothetical protein
MAPGIGRGDELMGDFVGEANACYYCGLPADTVDHVIPKTIIGAVQRSGDEILADAIANKSRRLTVPACRECNGLAGWKYHETLSERTEYVRGRLAQKHRKALATPDWTPRELFGLSAALRRRVIASLWERDLTRRRLRYRGAGLTPASFDSTWWSGDDAVEEAPE